MKNILLLCLLSFIVNASEAPIFACKGKFKEGGYRSFEEMLQNNPTIEVEVELDPIENPQTESYIKDQYEHKYIDKKGKVKKWSNRKCGTFWGCSFGGVVYIKGKTTSQLHLREHYSWYKSANVPSALAGMNTGPNNNPAVRSYGNSKKLTYTYFYLDMKTGEQVLLNVRSLKKLIASDAELLADFSKEERPKEYLIDYLERLNRRLKK